jgi:uncharacterized protein (DUF934 family)
MPTLIKLHQDQNGYHATLANDAYTVVADDTEMPHGPVIISLSRFRREGGPMLDDGRLLGVQLEAEEAVEDLVYDLPRLAVVALNFPKFRNGVHYSSARLLRERYHFAGEIRAVGDVTVEQGQHMVRCGIDAFAPADGTGPEAWTRAANKYRHVYQKGADDREPAFVERGS